MRNEADVLSALRDCGEALGMRVRAWSAASGAPLAAHLAQMVATRVLVARHGPLLANALFLPPGKLPCLSL